MPSEALHSQTLLVINYPKQRYATRNVYVCFGAFMVLQQESHAGHAHLGFESTPIAEVSKHSPHLTEEDRKEDVSLPGTAIMLRWCA